MSTNQKEAQLCESKDNSFFEMGRYLAFFAIFAISVTGTESVPIAEQG